MCYNGSSCTLHGLAPLCHVGYHIEQPFMTPLTGLPQGERSLTAYQAGFDYLYKGVHMTNIPHKEIPVYISLHRRARMAALSGCRRVTATMLCTPSHQWHTTAHLHRMSGVQTWTEEAATCPL